MKGLLIISEIQKMQIRTHRTFKTPKSAENKKYFTFHKTNSRDTKECNALKYKKR